ncbi:MAG: acyltransferase [Lachnospiraceae bacterium]|nr:acyltransferase [Lachnospiraceae bacterium]MCD7765745.1 acyltransferase [Lachnospiraceae bacterium]
MESFTRKDTRICKGIAVILLIVHHSVAVLAATTFLSGTEIMSQAVSLTKLCVGIFSVLSGYGLYCSFDRKEEKSVRTAAGFVGNHLLKIYSVFWLTAAFLFAAVLLSGRTPADLYGEHAAASFVLDMLGLSWLTGTGMFVNSWWYITLILVDYILFPVLYFLLKRLNIFLVWLLIFTALLIPAVCGENNVAVYSFFFLYGMIFARLDLFTRLLDLPKDGEKRPGFGVLLCLLYAGILFLLCVIRQTAGSGWKVQYYMDWLISAVLIALVSRCVHMLRWRRRGPLEFLGEYSFEIYLVHGTILKYFSGFVYRDFFWGHVILRLLIASAVCGWLIRRVEILLHLPGTRRLLPHISGDGGEKESVNEKK